ncbi:MAG: hypothetical protein LBM20_07890 [Rikenellaceae bacterium]|jgi:hypothetical protein|nr:hypothetical protein [Rikenellaceae bacterium]
MAKKLLEYIKTLPFTTAVKKPPKRSFREAAEACHAVSVKVFTDELRSQINEYFDKKNVRF